MSILAFVVVGLFAGFLASMIVDHRGRGLVVDLVVGIAGALVGGFVFRVMASSGVTGFNLWSVFVSTTGAVILLALAHIFGRRTA